MRADGKRAASAEDFERGAFGLDGEACLFVIDEYDGFADEDVAISECRARLDGECSLAGRGAEFIGREALVDPFCAAEAVETTNRPIAATRANECEACRIVV